jgi:hypothetical protein
MIKKYDSYYELFLFPNHAGFAFSNLFFAIFGPPRLKILKDRSIESNDFNLSPPLSPLCLQLLINIVEVQSTKKFNIETHKSEIR